MNKKTIIVIISLSLLLCINISYGQNQTMMGVGVGISLPTGDGSEYWKMGFDINGEWFKQYSENLFIGGRIAYNRWSPDEDELTKDTPSGIEWDISGSLTIIELLPSVRYVPSTNQGQQFQFFGQIGAGLYSLTANGEVKGSYYGSTVTVSADESSSDFGINFGAGAIIVMGNTKFLIYPNYNIVFTDEESTKYFTFNLEILLGK